MSVVEVARQATTGENITQGVVMFKGSRKDREASEKRKLLRFLDATLTARYRDSREQRVASVAGAVLEYLEDP